MSPAHADAIRDRQWHLSYLQASKLHTITKGAGVTVAVIDSGVNGRHPDLAGNVLKGRNFIKPGGDGWTDTDGHGTAMASLIAGHGHGPTRGDGVLGLAPGAKILPVRTGTGAEVEGGRDRLVEAVRWAVDHGAKVINMSIRSSNLDQREAITYALEHDVVVVAAAGNTTQHDRRVLAPARYPGVVAVSGTDQDGNFTGTSMQGKEIVLAAPAVDITAAGAGKRGRYTIGTGTSAASALVAGAAAPDPSRVPAAQCRERDPTVDRTADDRGPDGRDPEYGYGVIHPIKALTADIAPVEHNPLLRQADPTRTPPSATDGGTASPPAGGTNSPTAGMLITLGVALGLAIGGVGLGLAMRSRSSTIARPSRMASQDEDQQNLGPQG